MTEPRGSVVTGAEDDGRGRRLQLVVGYVGWLILVALLIVLVANPSLAALHLAVFFVTVITLTTFIAVETAIQLRSQVIRDRAVPLPVVMVDRTVDTLGRALEPPDPTLVGEIVLETRDGIRHYLPGDSE